MQKNNPYLVVNLSAFSSPDHMLGENSADREEALEMLKDLTNAFERYVDDASKKSMSDSDKITFQVCKTYLKMLVDEFDDYWYKKYALKWDHVPEAVYEMILWWGVNRPQEDRFNKEVREKAQIFYDRWK